MKQKVFTTLVAIFFAGFITGCGEPTLKLYTIKQGNSDISQFRTAIIKVEPNSESMVNKEGYPEVRNDVERVFMEKLTQSKRFAVIKPYDTDDKPNGALLIKLTIVNFNYVSSASSVMFGVMSGNGSIKLREELINTETGATIGKYETYAQASSSGGIFRGSTGTLIVDVSEKLINQTILYKKDPS